MVFSEAHGNNRISREAFGKVIVRTIEIIVSVIKMISGWFLKDLIKFLMRNLIKYLINIFDKKFD